MLTNTLFIRNYTPNLDVDKILFHKKFNFTTNLWIKFSILSRSSPSFDINTVKKFRWLTFEHKHKRSKVIQKSRQYCKGWRVIKHLDTKSEKTIVVQDQELNPKKSRKMLQGVREHMLSCHPEGSSSPPCRLLLWPSYIVIVSNCDVRNCHLILL